MLGGLLVGREAPVFAVRSGADSLAADVDVEADDRAVDHDSARPEGAAGRESGRVAGRDLLHRGREVGLAQVETGGNRGGGPGFEVDVPERAVVELARLLGNLLE